MSSNREPGFYWVRSGKTWMVAEWDARYGRWDVCFDNECYPDTAFSEIDERRIVRSEENT